MERSLSVEHNGVEWGPLLDDVLSVEHHGVEWGPRMDDVLSVKHVSMSRDL